MKYHHKLHHQRLAVLRRIQDIQPPQLQPLILLYYRSYALYKLQKTKPFTKKTSTIHYEQFKLVNNRIISMNSI